MGLDLLSLIYYDFILIFAGVLGFWGRLDAEVDYQGVHISNGLTQEAITALENIALTIDDVLYGQVGGSKK